MTPWNLINLNHPLPKHTPGSQVYTGPNPTHICMNSQLYRDNGWSHSQFIMFRSFLTRYISRAILVKLFKQTIQTRGLNINMIVCWYGHDFICTRHWPGSLANLISIHPCKYQNYSLYEYDDQSREPFFCVKRPKAMY